MVSEPDVADMRHCSGCEQDKPLQQFQVTKENKDGSTWIRNRNWCHACCNALAKRQVASMDQRVEASRQRLERDEEQRRARWQALGPLPLWCEAQVLDSLVNGVFSRSLVAKHRSGANPMLLLWEAFQKHERAVGEPLGGRGNRFLQSMAGLLKEDEAKFRQKLKHMCKREDNLSSIFETASVARLGRRRSKLRPV